MKRIKRTCFAALALSLLLTGCGISGGSDHPSSPATETVPATSEPTTSEPTDLPGGNASLLDRREAFDDSGVLWYIPNAQIEAQQYPMLHAFAGNLLMTESKYISDGNSELMLTLLSAETGETLESCTIGLTESVEPQILGDHIAICDSRSGTVIVLDQTLKETARYPSAADSGQWFLCADLDTLYKCSYLDGISAVSLATGEVLTHFALAEFSVCSMADTGVCFTGMDLETQRYCAYCLDLSRGKLVEPPFSGDFVCVYRSGEMWLGSLYGEENMAAFGKSADAYAVPVQGGACSLLDPTEHILFTGVDGTLSLYDAEGTFLSSCALPGKYVQSMVWQEALGGYLLLVNGGEESNCLLFWDIHGNTSGANLQMQSLSDLRAIPGGTSADAALYERAKMLSDRFGVEIRIADQCETEFPYFNCYQVSDYDAVSAGLDLLEDALSVFPEGFFEQLIYGHLNRVEFQLVGGLNATNGFGGDISYAAFTDTGNSACRIVLDLYAVAANSVWHELSHAIDKRLSWDAAYREGARFSEEAWLSYNPEGFSYSEEYGASRTDAPAEWYTYFVDDYAMTNATEDRARIFESAMENSGTLFQNAGLRAKLQYYSDCIRDCFDTAQWPGITAWEEPLHQE